MEELVGKHSEIGGMEISASPPGQAGCVTIASTEAKNLGEKCDHDEFTAIKTNRPFVEKEKEGGKDVFDVTMPLHDRSGKVIGTVGLDFKPTPGQEQSQVVEQATQVVHEFEGRIPSSAKLFEPAE